MARPTCQIACIPTMVQLCPEVRFGSESAFLANYPGAGLWLTICAAEKLAENQAWIAQRENTADQLRSQLPAKSLESGRAAVSNRMVDGPLGLVTRKWGGAALPTSEHLFPKM